MPTRSSTLSLRPGRLLALASAVCLTTGLVAAPASAATQVVFSYTGSAQTWTVPPNVYSAEFDVVGAAGGEWHTPATVGLGARVQVTIDVTPGEKLQINVGGKGGRLLSWNTRSDARAGKGGWNGGGDGGATTGDDNGVFRSGGGGGASDVRRDPTKAFPLTSRIIVAGGGGGNSYHHDEDQGRTFGIGGDAGGLGDPTDGHAGRDGGPTGCQLNAGGFTEFLGAPNGHGAHGGKGGSATSGGNGGAAGDANGLGGTNQDGAGGTFGKGGDGGDAFGCAGGDPGGGGGGGWYGGGGGGGGASGGGAVGGGGGGGSSHAPQGATITAGYGTSDGSITIRFTAGDPPPTAHQPDNLIRLGTGRAVGDGIINQDGKAQSRAGSGAAGTTVRFSVIVQNDGNVTERFTVHATGAAAKGWRVTYAVGKQDVSGGVGMGTYQTPMLLPGSSITIAVKVFVPGGATAAAKVSRLVTTSSTGGPSDAVRLSVRRP
ncbi:MAG: hypothetical protein U0869_06245 [Chloroflexota bacterium]